MRVTVWCIVFLAGLMVNSSISPLSAQSASSEDLAKYYENCIVKKISSCKGKTVLKTSRSVNLQSKADLAARQVTFLKTNKNLLILEMVEQEIDPSMRRQSQESSSRTTFFLSSSPARHASIRTRYLGLPLPRCMLISVGGAAI